jgi:tetratricopeptide (TPR) repeat protein
MDKSLRGELSPLLALTRALFDKGLIVPAALLANWIHTPLRGLGRFREDRASLVRFIHNGVCTIESEDPRGTATLLSNLALTLNSLGDLPSASNCMKRSIAIKDKHFDPDHPVLAIRYNNLAHIERADGNRSKACELWHKARAILRKHFDRSHPDVVLVEKSLNTHCRPAPAAFVASPRDTLEP